MRIIWLGAAVFAATLSLSFGNVGFGQIRSNGDVGAAGGGDRGPQPDRTTLQKLKVGIVVKAVGGPCNGIVATIPVPFEWPEQQVRILEEDVTPTVASHDYRMLSGDGVKQMLVEIPELPAGQEARCLITFELTRRSLLPPKQTEGLSIPKKVGRDVLLCLGPSPYIESKNPKIASLAKELTADQDYDWKKVEALYEYVRTNCKYVSGQLKGAQRALNDKSGDCEDLCSLFIALCRSAKIPARTVWVQGHCYPEFYLSDEAGKGYWFPCQTAGNREFGGITEARVILQKGDNFKDPDRPRDKLRYVSEFMTGAGGGGKPEVRFVRE
jgi:hypothetical protein